MGSFDHGNMSRTCFALFGSPGACSEVFNPARVRRQPFLRGRAQQLLGGSWAYYQTSGFPLKGSFKKDIGMRGCMKLLWEYLEAHGT